MQAGRRVENNTRIFCNFCLQRSRKNVFEMHEMGSCGLDLAQRGTATPFCEQGNT
jgi:hypothetical protein